MFNHRISPQRLISSSISLITVSLLTTSLLKVSPVLAQYYIPPDTDGLPPRQGGGGTRGAWVSSPSPLTALMPENGSGLTVAERPTFFCYVPQPVEQVGQVVEFVLLDEATDTIVYETTLTTTSAGIMSLELPETVMPLEIGKPYHWYFSIITDTADRSSDPFVDGWVQRVVPEPALASQLSIAAPIERPILYASTGIWYDALTELANLRRLHPGDPTLNEQWVNLLSSVGLDNLAGHPLIEVQASPTVDVSASERAIPTPNQIPNGGFLLPDSDSIQPRQPGGTR